MTETAKKVADDARRLGVKAGDVLLVHSSFKSLGAPEASPADLIDGLIKALDGGTLVMPALSYMHCNPGQRVFNARTTPSNVGAIPEYFRTHYPVLRSLCPTHSCVALGARAHEITAGQEVDSTPCGAHSPFRRVMELGGRVLFVGCGANCNTSMHAVEELVRPDYLFGDTYEYSLRRTDGSTVSMNCAAHNFNGYAQKYSRLTELMPENAIYRGRILAADCIMMDAPTMWRVAEEYYRKDQHYFVDKV